MKVSSAGKVRRGVTLSRILLRMQSQAVSFAVADDCAEPVRANRVHFFEHFPAQRGDLGDGIADAAVHIHVEQDAAIAVNGIGHGYQAAAIAFLMHENRERKPIEGFGADFGGQNCLVEVDRTLKVGNGDVEPDGAVVIAVVGAHACSCWRERVRGEPNMIPVTPPISANRPRFRSFR